MIYQRGADPATCDSLQHATEYSNDDEMQLAFQAGLQLETGVTGRRKSPNYVEAAQQQWVGNHGWWD